MIGAFFALHSYAHVFIALVQSPRLSSISLGLGTEVEVPHKDIALVGFLSKEKDQNLGQMFQTIYEKVR